MINILGMGALLSCKFNCWFPPCKINFCPDPMLLVHAGACVPWVFLTCTWCFKHTWTPFFWTLIACLPCLCVKIGLLDSSKPWWWSQMFSSPVRTSIMKNSSHDGQSKLKGNLRFCWLFCPILSCMHPIQNQEGSSGIWTRDLSHPKRESYP